MGSAARRESLIGSKIGNYSIISTLGEGGMGVVYLAEHPMIGKRVAIKILHPDHAARSDAAARCFLEARAVNEIRHPNVVDIIDCGVADLGEHGSVHYLLMEYLEGESLRAVMRGGAIPPARATAIAIEVGGSLAAAHAKGIIHRDIKPENIFLSRETTPGRQEHVKVLDFGIAKLMDGRTIGDRSSGDRLTQSGVTLGTPQYMAPEQLDGEDLDGRVDVYSLGIVLYEMLVGAAPFAEETTARGVWRRMNELPTIAPAIAATLPPGLEALLMRTLDPDRIRRPEMADFVRALEDPSADLPNTTGPHTIRLPKAVPERPSDRSITPTDTAMDPPLRSPAMRWLTVIPIAAVGVALVVFAIVLLRNPDSPVPSVPSDPPKQTTPDPVVTRSDIVTIEIVSVPPGAEIFVGAESAPRGIAPTKLTLARASAVEIRLRLDGYTEQRRSISALRNDTIELPLISSLSHLPKRKPPRTIQPPIKIPPRDAGVTAAPPVDGLPAGPAPPATKPTGDNLLPPRKKTP